MPKAKKARFALYAVAKGRKGPGVYATWEEAKPHTVKVSGAEYKGFNTHDEVEEYFREQKVDLNLVSWGKGTRLPGDSAPDAQPHVVAQPASQGVAVAVAVYASSSQSSQSSGMAEAASAAMARAVEVLSQDAPRASSEPAPATDPLGADKELPPLPPSSQPTQEADDAAPVRAASEPPKEKEKTALLRLRNQVEVALTALCSPNGDGTSAPEVPNAAFEEAMREMLREIDHGLGTEPQDGGGPQQTQ